ncbi:hypothetical protein AAF712_000682 [Marasmius tenuissimus]|uniref:Uncharacterized protein n=1 Tax=Marasmius tenuissimus TaxID=585030 RepID=A0ABR3ACU0_9AGAR
MTIRDPEWLYASIFNPLAALPLLQELSVGDFSGYFNNGIQRISTPPHLFNHGRLTSLTFDVRFTHENDYISSLTEISAHNPKITHLKLNNYISIAQHGTKIYVFSSKMSMFILYL